MRVKFCPATLKLHSPDSAALRLRPHQLSDLESLCRHRLRRGRHDTGERFHVRLRPSIRAWGERLREEFIPHLVEVRVSHVDARTLGRPKVARRFNPFEDVELRNFFEPMRTQAARRLARELGVSLVDPAKAKPKPVEEPKQLPPPNTISSTVWRDGEHFVAKLLKRGYVKIGEGCYSTVLAKPDSDKVIKVNRSPDTWLDFVIWATKSGHAGGFAPKVYSFRRVSGKRREFYVAVVERLAATVRQASEGKPDINAAHEALRNFVEYKDDGAGIRAERTFPGSIRFGVEFRAKFGSRGLDLHSANFMVRKDGTLVCTDPLTNGRCTAPARMRSRDLASLPLAA